MARYQRYTYRMTISNPLYTKSRDIASQAFEHIYSFTVGPWKKNIEAAIAVAIPNYVIQAMLFESSYFAEYILEQKAVRKFTQEELKKFTQYVRENFIMLYAETVFYSEEKALDADTRYQEVEEMYDDFREERIAEYRAQTSKESQELFKRNLFEAFEFQNIPMNLQLLNGYAQNIVRDLENITIG